MEEAKGEAEVGRVLQRTRSRGTHEGRGVKGGAIGGAVVVMGW